MPPAGWGISSRAHSAFQLLAVLGQVDRRRARAEHQLAAAARPASFSGVWPPSDDDHADELAALLGLDDVHARPRR